jgi:hypothetical protein
MPICIGHRQPLTRNVRQMRWPPNLLVPVVIKPRQSGRWRARPTRCCPRLPQVGYVTLTPFLKRISGRLIGAIEGGARFRQGSR